MTTLNFRVLTEREEYIRFNLCHAFFRQRRISGTSIFYIILIALITAVSVYYFLQISSFSRVVFNDLVPLLGLFAVLLLYPLLLVFKSMKVWKTNPFLQREQEYTMDEKGLICRSAVNVSEISWDVIYSVVEYGDLYGIYLSKNRIFIIPKQALGGSKNDGIFRNLVREHLETSAIRFKKR